MKKIHTAIWIVLSLGTISPIAHAQTSPAVPVTIDNYNRAQSDVYFALIAKGGGFGSSGTGAATSPKLGNLCRILPNPPIQFATLEIGAIRLKSHGKRRGFFVPATPLVRNIYR
jgi:hypothetical protein